MRKASVTCYCSLPHIWNFVFQEKPRLESSLPRVLLSSIALVYSETLRTVPLLKMPVLSAHLSDKRAPCILPYYAGSAAQDQDRAAVDHLVFIASSLRLNESTHFSDSTSTPNPARSGLRCVQEFVFCFPCMAGSSSSSCQAQFLVSIFGGLSLSTVEEYYV